MKPLLISFSQETKKRLFAIGLMLSMPFIFYFMFTSGKVSIIPVFGAVALGLILVIIDIQNFLSRGLSSVVLPIGISSSLLYTFIHSSAIRISNLAGWGLFLVYYLVAKQEDKTLLWKRVRSMGWLLALFILLLFFSYALNGSLTIGSTSLLSILGQSSGYELLPWIGAVGYYLSACLYCKDRKDIARLVKIIVIVGLFQPLFVLQQVTGVFSSVPWINRISKFESYRFYGSLFDFELAADYLSAICVWTTSYFLSSRRFIDKVVSSVLLVVLLLTGLATGERGFWVACALGILLVILLNFSREISFFKIVTLIVAGVIVTYSIVTFAPSWIWNWANTRVNQTQSEFITGNYFNRVSLYQLTLKALQHMPFYGYGGNQAVILSYTSLGRLGSSIDTSPHSMYSWSLLTSGYLGLFSLILLYLFAIIYCYKIWKQEFRTGSLLRQAAAALLAITCVIVVDSVKIEFVRSADMIQIYFVLFAIISSWSFIISQDVNSPYAASETGLNSRSIA